MSALVLKLLAGLALASYAPSAIAAAPEHAVRAEVSAACVAIEHDPRVFASLMQRTEVMAASEALARDAGTPLRVRLCAIGLRGAVPDTAAFSLWRALEGSAQREVAAAAVRAAALAHLQRGSLVSFVLAREAHASDTAKRTFVRLLARDKDPRAPAVRQRLSASLSSAGAAARPF